MVYSYLQNIIMKKSPSTIHKMICSVPENQLGKTETITFYNEDDLKMITMDYT